MDQVGNLSGLGACHDRAMRVRWYKSPPIELRQGSGGAALSGVQGRGLCRGLCGRFGMGFLLSYKSPSQSPWTSESPTQPQQPKFDPSPHSYERAIAIARKNPSRSHERALGSHFDLKSRLKWLPGGYFSLGPNKSPRSHERGGGGVILACYTGLFDRSCDRYLTFSSPDRVVLGRLFLPEQNQSTVGLQKRHADI